MEVLCWCQKKVKSQATLHKLFQAMAVHTQSTTYYIDIQSFWRVQSSLFEAWSCPAESALK